MGYEHSNSRQPFALLCKSLGKKAVPLHCKPFAVAKAWGKGGH